MIKFRVDLPFTGYVTSYIEAIDENDAIEKAFQRDYDLNSDTVELEFHVRVVEGNVSHAVLNSAHAEPEEDQ